MESNSSSFGVSFFTNLSVHRAELVSLSFKLVFLRNARRGGFGKMLVAAILKEEYPGVSLTLSHTVSGVGLLEREHAAVLNESLKPYFLKTTSDFDIALQSLGLDCPLYLTQNDGTILSAKDFLEFPVRTFLCGTSNSVRGASHLACIEDATVIDIGGTYTHVCGMAGGFPRLTSSIVEMGGVRTSLRIPAEKRICLGGGSHVISEQSNDAKLSPFSSKKSVKVGPLSCGNKLTVQGMVFGELVENQLLTATDTAVAAGVANVGKPEKADQLDEQLVASAVKEMRLMVEAAIDQIKMESRDQPVILLGGGSILIDDKQKLQGASSVIRPPLFEVANAVGAALAQVGTEYGKIVKMDKKIKQIKQEHTAGKSVFYTGVRDAIQMTMSDVADESKTFTSSVNFGEVFRQSMDGDVPKDGIKDAGISDASAEQEQTTVEDIDSQPRIDPSTGEWLLSEWDIDCITLGASILGCGGGGEPYLQKLQCKLILRDGKKIRIITPESINNTGFVSCVAALGAPLIEIEKPAGDTIIDPVICLQQIITSNNILDEEDIEEDLNGLKYIEDFHGQLVKNVDTPGLSAIMSAEIGGANSLIALYAGGLFDLPVVDADFMGRAFPEFQMCVPNMFGIPAYPCCMSDVKGRTAVVLKAKNAQDIENHLRKVVQEMGCQAGLCFGSYSKSDIMDYSVKYTFSRVWRLGQAVLQARRDRTDPIQAILQWENGKTLIVGKIADVKTKLTGAFSKGKVIIDGYNAYAGQSLHVECRNENLTATLHCMKGEFKVVACVPDLIAIVDTDTGEAIHFEEVRNNLRVTVLVFASAHILRTPTALKVVGPQAFGYPEDVQYHPVADYTEYKPVHQWNRADCQELLSDFFSIAWSTSPIKVPIGAELFSICQLDEIYATDEELLQATIEWEQQNAGSNNEPDQQKPVSAKGRRFPEFSEEMVENLAAKKNEVNFVVCKQCVERLAT
ncbi:uncharacterized protein LOC100376245 [Saccoglossus kowalevskii]